MSPSSIIQLAKFSEYLSFRDVLKGKELDKNLPQKIYNIRKSVNHQLTNYPSSDTLQKTANYLYAICGKYLIEAMAISASGGIIITPSTSTTVRVANELEVVINASNDGTAVFQADYLIGATISSTIFLNNGAMQRNVNFTFNTILGAITFINYGDLQINDVITGTYYTLVSS